MLEEEQLELPLDYPKPSTFGELFQEVFGDNVKYVRVYKAYGDITDEDT